MEGKRSNNVLVLFLLISMISFSNAGDDDTQSALYKHYQTSAASHPSHGKFVSMEMILRYEHPAAANRANWRGSEIMKRRLQSDQISNATLFLNEDGGAGYYTTVGVGNQSMLFNMTLDTGSTVNWVQCSPCKHCDNHHSAIFDPSRSQTYHNLTCMSNTCQLLDSPPTCTKTSNSEVCQYNVSYRDGSSTKGYLANETVTFGVNNHSIAGIALGCGNDNKGSRYGSSGILGLGRGKLSFPNQLALYNYRNQFSYCLPNHASGNKSIITFGQTPLPSNTSFTPILINNVTGELGSHYYVNLTGISVGDSIVKGFNSSISDISEDGTGGVIVDSGATYTYLEKLAYNKVRDAFRNSTEMMNLTKVTPPDQFKALDTCYKMNNVSAPPVVLHFADGADMSLPADNCLVLVDPNAKTYCFAFAPSTQAMSIIGNTQQQSFGIMFDLETNIMAISANTC